MPNEAAKSYYNNLPADKRVNFRKSVIELNHWSSRQFRLRFIQGQGWIYAEAYLISNALQLPIEKIYPVESHILPQENHQNNIKTK